MTNNDETDWNNPFVAIENEKDFASYIRWYERKFMHIDTKG